MSAAAADTAAAAPAPKDKAPAAAADADAPDSAPDSDVSPTKKAAAATTTAPPPPAVETGTILFCGGTDWATIGRSGGGGAGGGKGGSKAAQQQAAAEADAERASRYPLLALPVRLAALDGVKIAFVAAGPAAAHCVAGDDQGRVWTWGRNERGQLGHGDYRQYNSPAVVTALQQRGVHAVGATAGKAHTVIWARDGSSWGWGLNTQGQLGIGSISTQAGGAAKKAAGAGAADDVRLAPHRVAVDGPVKCAAAGSNFTVWLTTRGKVFVSADCFFSGVVVFGRVSSCAQHTQTHTHTHTHTNSRPTRLLSHVPARIAPPSTSDKTKKLPPLPPPQNPTKTTVRRPSRERPPRHRHRLHVQH
jgi:hypothetical protein